MAASNLTADLTATLTPKQIRFARRIVASGSVKLGETGLVWETKRGNVKLTGRRFTSYVTSLLVATQAPIGAASAPAVSAGTIEEVYPIYADTTPYATSKTGLPIYRAVFNGSKLGVKGTAAAKAKAQKLVEGKAMMIVGLNKSGKRLFAVAGR